MLVSAPALAGPQDDPPPVQVEAGDQRFLSDATYSLTLSLDEAAGSKALEPGQVKQARAAAASAQEGGSGPRKPEAQPDAPVGAEVGAAQNTTGNGGDGSGGAGVGECSYRPATVPAGAPEWAGNDPAAGTLLVNPCNGPGQFVFVPNPPAPAPGPAVAAARPAPPPPPPDPAVLARQAYGELSLPEPVAHRSPPEDNSDPQYGGLPYTWVGLSTFYWVEDWQPLARTVTLRGVSATVTATPTGLTFDPGDGNPPVSCDGPGRPWVEADGNKPPSDGACGYTYRAVTPDGPLTATTSVQWSVNWTSSTGASGTFPVSTTSSSSSFLVEQIQVVIR